MPFLVTLETSHFEMPRLKDDAVRNIADILMTRDTSHFEISPLNEVALSNIALISTTLDTSHPEMSLFKRCPEKHGIHCNYP